MSQRLAAERIFVRLAIYFFISSSQGTIAALHFILTSAARYDVDDISLIQEIQQLGLPQENSFVIGKEYSQGKIALRKALASQSYRLCRVLETEVVSIGDPAKGTDIAMNLRLLIDNNSHNSANSMAKNDDTSDSIGGRKCMETQSFDISAEKLDLLIHELSKAKEIMKGLNNF